MPERVNLKALSPVELRAYTASLGLPGYRADQLLHWMYEKYACHIQEITEFSKQLRNTLDGVARISQLELSDRRSAADGTEKYLFTLEDGSTIETVMIPDEDRTTLCISSQVGCAMGCSFCLTGQGGLVRNLGAHEIVEQVLAASRLVRPRRLTNIVLMGMGEPLANIDQVAEALRRITGLIGISKRKITLSTSGLVPALRELPRRAPDVNLAVSLNAATDEVRDMIMPVNRRYPLRMLLEACRNYPLGPGRRITFEYVLIDSVNDSRADAVRLVTLLRGIPCKVNLIPYNPHKGGSLRRPPEQRVLEFQSVLDGKHIIAPVRESRGQDILAACGQLRGLGRKGVKTAP